MIRLPGNRVAVRPRFDSDRSQGHTGLRRSFVDARGADKGIEVARALNEDAAKLIIPNEAKTRCDQGIVKYIGPDVKELKIGDYVIFSGYVGTLVNMEGEGKLIILPEDFIVFTLVRRVETEIPGLYFQDELGSFFPATYETAFEMIAAAMKEDEWLRSSFDVRVPAPTTEELELSKGL